MPGSLAPPLDGGSSAATTQSPYSDTSPSPAVSPASPSSVIFITIILAFSAVVLVSVYIFLRYISDSRHRSVRTFSIADDASRRDGASNQNSNQPQRHVADSNSLLQSLPLFDFRSVKGNLTGGDCAVCLSKFELPDQLRLLPLCCHAFHAECIDTWIVTNQTCPLCRSSVLPSETDVLNKILPAQSRGISNYSGSFRIEIGSISRREGGGAAEAVRGAIQSYSSGSFEYIVNENGYEVSIESRGIADYISAEKEPSIGIPIPEPPGEVLATGVAGGRSWLRDYFDRTFSSRTTSFRGSGRFFPGSIRRTGPIVAAEDLEANRAGEEIAELFRWLSGI